MKTHHGCFLFSQRPLQAQSGRQNPNANITDISPAKALPFPCLQPNRFPRGSVVGKARRALNRHDSEARYSLIVSLHVPETNAELLTPLQLKVDALIASQIQIPS